MSLSGRSDASSRILAAARWVVLAPVALGAAFVAGSLVARVPTPDWTAPAYGLPVLSGFVYVITALYAAYRIAPSRETAAMAILGVLLVGDLIFVHLVLPSGVVPDLASLTNVGGVFGILFDTLQGDAFPNLRYGGQARLAGALAGCVAAWWWTVRIRPMSR